MLGIVGPAYQVAQNRESFDWFQPFIDSGEVTYHTAGSLSGGTRTWVLAQVGVNGQRTFEVRPGDRVAKFLLLASSHDGSLAHTAMETPVRVVCRNTLSMALSSTKAFKVRHTSGAKGKLDDARESIAKANEAFSATAEAYRKLAVCSVDAAGIKAYARKVYQVADTEPATVGAGSRIALIVGSQEVSDRQVGQSVSTRMENIINDVAERAQSGRGNTGASFWDAYNGVTERVTWGGQDSKTSADKRMSSAWFGNGSAVSARALKVALQTVGA
jgi:phage/plasmid-like protein (TIGR03299 family)